MKYSTVTWNCNYITLIIKRIKNEEGVLILRS